jgi:hypothetical protein
MASKGKTEPVEYQLNFGTIEQQVKILFRNGALNLNFCTILFNQNVLLVNFSLENREYDRRDPSRWSRDTLFPQKLSITSLTSGGRSVGIVRSQT